MVGNKEARRRSNRETNEACDETIWTYGGVSRQKSAQDV
jgi:hypothetical protein